MSTQDTATLARTIYDAFNSRNLDAALSLASEDIELKIMPFDQSFHGRDGFRQYMQGWITAFSDAQVDTVSQVAGPDGVTTEFLGRGTHDGALSGPGGDIPATGRTIAVPMTEVWYVRDGKVFGLHLYFDTATMMRQLGVIQ